MGYLTAGSRSLRPELPTHGEDARANLLPPAAAVWCCFGGVEKREKKKLETFDASLFLEGEGIFLSCQILFYM